MKQTDITLHTRFQIGKVDPRIFGGFLEHLGRAVYQGVYEPGSRHADENGFRQDVLETLRRLNMTAIRYPGGNFASGYHWLDGVGRRDNRHTVHDLAWKTMESNQFGTDEYIRLCRKMDWQPMLTVNLGTGTPQEARDWVEYCNCACGTKYADMRVSNGNKQPYGVSLWCLGNEMDGDWQLGHVPADKYALRARQAAEMMKNIDPAIELVACGSCALDMPTYMEWDRLVLECLGDMADYLSLHRYVGNPDNDTPDYLAVTNSIDRQIEEMDGACRFVQSKLRSKKRAYLSFDEWNVWYNNTQTDGEGKTAPHLMEQVYNLEDALVVAGFLHSFIRHADVVKIANLAQIVNVIAPILTQGDQMLIQTIFYPFEMFSRRRDGASLQVTLDGPTYEGASNGRVHYIDASAILGDGKLHVFATNRSVNAAASIRVNMADRAILSLENAELLNGPGPKASNTFKKRDVVRSQPYDGIIIKKGQALCELPPLSLLAATLAI